LSAPSRVACLRWGRAMRLQKKPVEGADRVEAAAEGDVDNLDPGHFGIGQ